MPQYWKKNKDYFLRNAEERSSSHIDAKLHLSRARLCTTTTSLVSGRSHLNLLEGFSCVEGINCLILLP
jgi:hypothetical protein